MRGLLASRRIPGVPRHIPRPLEKREFALYFVGSSASYFGDALVSVALVFAVLDSGNSVIGLAAVLAAQTVPRIIFGLVGGVAGDRAAREVMIAADVARAACQIVLASLVATGRLAIPAAIAIVAVYGIADAFFTPSSVALLPRVVPDSYLEAANALLSISRSTASIIGPAIAGLIVAISSPAIALYVDAATFALSAACLGAIRVSCGVRASVEPVSSQLKEGLNEFVGRPWLVVSVCGFAAYYVLFLAPFYVLGPAVAKSDAGGALGWGAILGSAAVGSVVGGLIAYRVRAAYPLRWSFVITSANAALLAALAVPLPVVALAGVALITRGGMAVVNVYWYATLQRSIPTRVLGRVSAYDWLGSVIGLPLGLLVVGVVAEAAGAEATLLAAAVVLLVAMLLTAAHRSVWSFHSLTPAPDGDTR